MEGAAHLGGGRMKGVGTVGHLCFRAEMSELNRMTLVFSE
jgi:hypothetical protein